MSPQNADLLNAASEAAALVREFLFSYGGMENGYDTWLTARENMGDLDWRTPRSDDMTITGMKRAIRDRLVPKLRAVIEKYGTGIELVVESEHVEHGCYKTTVTAQLKCSVNAI